MQMTFQKLCIRPEVGFAYDKSSIVELSDGGSFTELLCKVTSKCDTSLLLLSSHKGKIRDFAVKLIGIETPQSESQSVTSAVLSSFKKGMSFINGKSTVSRPEEVISDVDQVAQAWDESYSAGYHGLQVLTLIDAEVMPDNESRKLYDLHQFVTITLQSINAYYMFQKPDVAFVYDSEFSAKQLKMGYPDADTFAIAVMWRFAEDPTVTAGPIRPTPIVRSAIRTEHVPSPRLPRTSFLENTTTEPGRFEETTTTTTERKPHSTTTTTVTKRKVIETKTKSPAAAAYRSPVTVIEGQSSQESDDDIDEDESSYNSTSPATPTKSPFMLFQPSPITTVKANTPVQRGRRTVQEPPQEPTAGSRRVAATRRVLLPPQPRVQHQEIDVPSVRKIKGTPKRQNVSRSTTRRATKRQHEETEEEEMDDEVVFKPARQVEEELQDEEDSMEMDENTDTNNTKDTTMEPLNITLSFDPPASNNSKPRGGRKSMAAAARKSLASEWPEADQQHMLHFFDNLNPQQSETSRVALTCKYALLQYDRDLSSKLLYQWLEIKGRPVQREVTNFTLADADQKATVLQLFRSLSDVQSEATRISFTLKFIQSQYRVAVTSKQLFGWLKEKPKKGNK